MKISPELNLTIADGSHKAMMMVNHFNNLQINLNIYVLGVIIREVTVSALGKQMFKSLVQSRWEGLQA